MHKEVVISGTGHRPDKLGGYGKTAFDKLVTIAKNFLIEENPDIVISGMALGWDQALAIAAIQLNIPFIAAVPFKGQESMWPRESQEFYRYILNRAHKVEVTSTGGYSPEKMQIRNKWMVDNSTKIAAMFNGSRGGTYNCIKYAEQVGKPIINLYDKLN